MPLLGYFCAALLAHALCLTPTATTASHPIAPGTTELVFTHGQPAGAYVDNETPDQCAVVNADHADGWQTVILGVSPGGNRVRCPGAINAQEWYPVGWTPGRWEPCPRARAYILQRTFHWPGQRAPTWKERRAMLRDALRYYPSLVLWY